MLLCINKLFSQQNEKHMSTNKSKVAVIGLGNIGKVIASNLVKGNREVIVASQKFGDANTLAQKLGPLATAAEVSNARSEEHTSELQSQSNLVCRLLLE